ncbi:type IV pilus modification protein PilV [Undibacterium sp.]|uniref:type IV pilus modification protein PilV n=1 Tax=Undibacterium sp. TaxID=1914977 RepID=UPI003751F9A4
MLNPKQHSIHRKAQYGLRNSARGGSLIEVLVAMLLIAFGFLGIGALFNFSISTNKSASSRLTATMLAQDYADIARANPIALGNSQYNRTILSFDPEAKAVSTVNTANLCSYPNCTVATSAANDQELFVRRVKALLPAGDYVATRLTAGNTNAIDIWILWVEGKNSSEPNTNNDVCPSVVTSASPAPSPFPRCLYARIAL